MSFPHKDRGILAVLKDKDEDTGFFRGTRMV